MQIKIDTEDVETLITFIEAKTEPEKIINYIKGYIYNPDNK